MAIDEALSELRISDEELAKSITRHSRFHDFDFQGVGKDLQDCRKELQWATEKLLYAVGNPQVRSITRQLRAKYRWELAVAKMKENE